MNLIKTWISKNQEIFEKTENFRKIRISPEVVIDKTSHLGTIRGHLGLIVTKIIVVYLAKQLFLSSYLVLYKINVKQFKIITKTV